jgi:hypothetical protein
MMDDVNPTRNEHDLVRECLTEIFRLNGYDDVSKLTQRDYEHISNAIETKTSILISVSTLKRLLHGEFTRIPQTATLNAISTYLNYKSWQDFKLSLRTKVVKVIRKEAVRNEFNIPPEKAKTPSNSIKRITVVSVGIVSVIIAVLFIRYAPGNSPGNFDKASFSAEKTTSNDIPNTVVFQYNIDDVKADSFFIQQSWDVNRRVRIFKNNYTLTDIYYEPGYHMAKLIANDSIIKTFDVNIPTNGWFLFAKEGGTESIPEYIKPAMPVIKNGSMILDKADLAANGIDASKEKRYIYCLYPPDVTVSSDNYTLKTRVRIHELRNNLCPTLMIEAMTQRYFNFVQSTTIGCASEAMTGFGENFISGKDTDLSPLCYDLTEWIDVEIRVENRHATISFNGKLVYSIPYKRSAGLLTGITFISNGLAEIDFVELKGLDGSVVYENDFSEPGL